MNPVTIIAFGYRYHGPGDTLLTSADRILDVRGLSNPHNDRTLRHLCGLCPAVARNVLIPANVASLQETMADMMDALDKRPFTLAIGCTGGRHRSVAIASWIASHIPAASLVLADVDRWTNRACDHAQGRVVNL